MSIHKKELERMFSCVARLWKENVGTLGEIDSRYGDGDHGFTMGKIAALVEKRVAAWDEEPPKEFIEELSVGILGIGGGSAGPLYGTMVEGLSLPLAEATAVVDAPLLKEMLAASRDALYDITKARCGDKTMMDALIPAVQAALDAPDDVGQVLAAAAKGAAAGAEDTKDMVSKFGRARSYGQQTLGTKDAGAVSTALFFEGLARGFSESELMD